MFITALQIAKSAIADRRGVTAMEYGLIAGVLAVGLAAAFGALTGRLTNAFNALNF
jgi:pilus assembly protein Flp/PilA